MRPSLTTTRTSLGTWGLLLLLLFLNWLGAQFDLGHFNAVVALGIAVLEMLLVVLIFMHVRFSSRLTWLFASAGLIWLLIMFDLILSDYLSRPVWKKPLTPNSNLTWSQAEALTSVTAPAPKSQSRPAAGSQSPRKLLVTPGGLTNSGRFDNLRMPGRDSLRTKPKDSSIP